MKKLLLLFFLTFCFSGNAQDLSGPWYWTSDDGRHNLEILLQFDETNVMNGNHCAIFYNGEKVDCVEEEERFSIALLKIAENVYRGTIESGYSSTKGKVSLNYNSRQDYMEFAISEAPAGEYYLPEKAILTR